jgi:hypothetical protein
MRVSYLTGLLVAVLMIMWLVNNHFRMSQPVKMVINVVLVMLICLWLLGMFGVLPVAPFRYNQR